MSDFVKSVGMVCATAIIIVIVIHMSSSDLAEVLLSVLPILLIPILIYFLD